MAVGSPEFYNDALEQAVVADNWETDNHYAALMTSSHTFTATHTTWADISANEVSQAGDYAPVDLTGEAITEAAGVVTIDANQVDYGSAVTITARHIVVLQGTAGAQSGTDRLVFSAALDDTADKSSTADDFKVDWNASGIATFTQTTP